MSKVNLEHLVPEQKACLGRVYQYVIERGRRNRAIAEKKRIAAASSASEVDIDHRSVSQEQWPGDYPHLNAKAHPKGTPWGRRRERHKKSLRLCGSALRNLTPT
jgi:hypothetical protein